MYPWSSPLPISRKSRKLIVTFQGNQRNQENHDNQENSSRKSRIFLISLVFWIFLIFLIFLIFWITTRIVEFTESRYLPNMHGYGFPNNIQKAGFGYISWLIFFMNEPTGPFSPVQCDILDFLDIRHGLKPAFLGSRLRLRLSRFFGAWLWLWLPLCDFQKLRLRGSPKLRLCNQSFLLLYK